MLSAFAVTEEKMRLRSVRGRENTSHPDEVTSSAFTSSAFTSERGLEEEEKKEDPRVEKSAFVDNRYRCAGESPILFTDERTDACIFIGAFARIRLRPL